MALPIEGKAVLPLTEDADLGVASDAVAAKSTSPAEDPEPPLCFSFGLESRANSIVESVPSLVCLGGISILRFDKF